MSLLSTTYLVAAIGIMGVVGNLTGGIPIILISLPWWNSLGFYTANILFGATIYLAFCRVGWWKWIVLIAMTIIEAAVRNATGATLALNEIPRWQGALFVNSIYLVGISGFNWIRKMWRKGRIRK